jgi:hypothetical protein
MISRGLNVLRNPRVKRCGSLVRISPLEIHAVGGFFSVSPGKCLMLRDCKPREILQPLRRKPYLGQRPMGSPINPQRRFRCSRSNRHPSTPHPGLFPSRSPRAFPLCTQSETVLTPARVRRPSAAIPSENAPTAVVADHFEKREAQRAVFRHLIRRARDTGAFPMPSAGVRPRRRRRASASSSAAAANA